jgi:DNA-binding SARP family transcriptional activator
MRLRIGRDTFRDTLVHGCKSDRNASSLAGSIEFGSRRFLLACFGPKVLSSSLYFCRMSGVPVPPSLQALLAAWHDSSHEKPRLLLLEGAAGIGKSHSLRAFAASGQNALVLSTACTGWLSAALRVFHPRLESERDPGFLQAARSLTPDLAWAQVAHAPALNDQNALWTALAQAFERLAQRSGGLILLLEDAHDAGADDLGALRVLYRRALLGKAPILIALSARPIGQDLLEGFGQDAAIADGFAPQRLSLSSLDLNGVTALLREHLHSEFLPDDLAAWLHARAEGHPLYTLELLRFLQDGGALRQAGTIWVFRTPSGKAVPRQLEAVLQARLLTVQADAQAWLGMTALAVIDRPVTVHEWSKLTRQNMDRIVEVANRLEHRGLLREELESGETVFSVAHPLYAPLIRAQLSQPELQRLHERSLEVCTNTSERARHARACGHALAGDLTLNALKDAQRRFAHSEVVGHAENLLAIEPGNTTVVAMLSGALFVLGETKRALEVSFSTNIPDVPDTSDHFEVLETRFHILMRLGQYDDALETALCCQQDQIHKATGRLNQALALMHLERFDEAHHVIDNLLLEFPETTARHGKALDILSDVVYSQGDLRASLEIGSRAATMLREFSDEQSLAITLTNLGGCCVHFGLWDQGRAYLEEAITLFVQRGAFQHVMFARNNFGFLLVESGQYAEARSLLLSVCQQAHTAKETRVEAAALTSLSDLEWQSNNLELAWQYHEQARALEQRESADLVDRAHLEALRGNISGALELVNAPQTAFHIQKAAKRARIALLAGQYDRVAVFLDETQTPEDHATRVAQFKLLRGLADHKLGQRDRAITNVLEAQQLAEAGGNTVIGLEARLVLALIEQRFNDARNNMRSLEAINAGGHTLTVQALFESEWVLLREESIKPRPSLQRTTLRTLGTFSLERDGQITILRDSKARDLLAHLLVAHLREDGPGVPRTQLIDAIWPESGDPEALEVNFRVTLKRLREKLGDAASVFSRDGIYELRDLNADVTHFLLALERLDFEAALGWYKGEFLPNIDVTDAEIVRAQLWQRFRDTALRSSLEQPASVAADLLEKLHRLEPLDVTLLERLTGTLRSANDPYRLERTLSRARTIFERETGEIPVELLLLERA